MAPHGIEIERWTAGSEYMRALDELGLHPDALMWAKDETHGKHVLLLFSEMVDHVGPLEMAKALFKAHDLAVTPLSIDPFAVHVHSPHQAIFREIVSELERNTDTTQLAQAACGGLRVQAGWIYRMSKPLTSSAIDLSRHWKRFEQNLNARAA